MSLEGQKCCETVRDAGYTMIAHWSPCSNKAKVERDGKFYCGVHDPERLKAKQAARDAESQRVVKLARLDIKLRAVRSEIADRAIECQPPIDDLHIDRLITKAKALKAEIEALEGE